LEPFYTKKELSWYLISADNIVFDLFGPKKVSFRINIMMERQFWKSLLKLIGQKMLSLNFLVIKEYY